MGKDGTSTIKGCISFPCCEKEKTIVYDGTSGMVSIKCPNCGHYAIFDYDSMTAVPGKTIKGAAHKLKRNKEVSLSK
ncbi:hypothetical protein [Phascolarctobacterium sp.]|uniref:hypothetical protein n=1 Tax=Phascolarctobacterium sp. TaxID=2049039 RepID=UPI003077535E